MYHDLSMRHLLYFLAFLIDSHLCSVRVLLSTKQCSESKNRLLKETYSLTKSLKIKHVYIKNVSPYYAKSSLRVFPKLPSCGTLH